MNAAANPAMVSFCTGVHNFVTGDVGVGVIPIGQKDGDIEFGSVTNDDAAEVGRLSTLGGKLSPYALQLPVDSKDLKPGNLTSQFKRFVDAYGMAAEKIGRIPEGRRRDERLSQLAVKETERGNSLGRDNRSSMAADSFLLSGIYYLNTEGNVFQSEMAHMFKRAAVNFMETGQSVLSALSWELAAVADPSKVGLYGSQAARLWFDVQKSAVIPEDRSIAISQGLQFGWHAASWKNVKRFLEVLAEIEFEHERLVGAADGQLRAAWLGSRISDVAYSAERLEEAIVVWELADAEAGLISRAQELAEQAMLL